MTRDVVIVGGGIAGLSAAWRLRHRDALLLEAGDRLGGRMRSDPCGQYWLNYGAHLFPAPGSLVDGMARERHRVDDAVKDLRWIGDVEDERGAAPEQELGQVRTVARCALERELVAGAHRFAHPEGLDAQRLGAYPVDGEVIRGPHPPTVG